MVPYITGENTVSGFKIRKIDAQHSRRNHPHTFEPGGPIGPSMPGSPWNTKLSMTPKLLLTDSFPLMLSFYTYPFPLLTFCSNCTPVPFDTLEIRRNISSRTRARKPIFFHIWLEFSLFDAYFRTLRSFWSRNAWRLKTFLLITLENTEILQNRSYPGLTVTEHKERCYSVFPHL